MIESLILASSAAGLLIGGLVISHGGDLDIERLLEVVGWS